MTDQPDCPHCGASLPVPPAAPRRGRPRVWCSDTCRRQAAAVRAAATRTGTAIRVVVVPRAGTAPPNRALTAPQIAELLLADPTACITLLNALAARAQSDDLDPRVRSAACELARAVLPESPPTQKPPPTAPQNRTGAAGVEPPLPFPET